MNECEACRLKCQTVAWGGVGSRTGTACSVWCVQCTLTIVHPEYDRRWQAGGGSTGQHQGHAFLNHHWFDFLFWPQGGPWNVQRCHMSARAGNSGILTVLMALLTELLVTRWQRWWGAGRGLMTMNKINTKGESIALSTVHPRTKSMLLVSSSYLSGALLGGKTQLKC